MRVPKKVKVGGVTYKVLIVDHINERDDLGETHHANQTIKIRKGEREHMESTFVHELIHCFNACISDEVQIDMIANSFYALVKDNPGIFERK